MDSVSPAAARRFGLGLAAALCSLVGAGAARAQAADQQMQGMEMGLEHRSLNPLLLSPRDCDEDEVWNVTSGMCTPLPRIGMPMRSAMVHGSAFVTGILQSGLRGRDGFAVPHLLMIDLGSSISDRQYLGVDFMGTAEKWTFPAAGYPQLLQIGERRADLQPYVDAQHPHSSPVMGLTVSDTIRLSTGSKDHLKLFFAPRGESTDGPVAFMHRPTGRLNPDTPLGHHIGQDVGHITSTVLGGALKLGDLRLEISAFHGEEPRPTRVELGVGRLDSAGARVIAEVSDALTLMGSVAFVNDPEPYVDGSVRFGASAYQRARLSDDWVFHNALIYGGITDYDHANLLHSVTEEFVFGGGMPSVWGRIEAVQRTPGELRINGGADRDSPRWAGAATLGYTHTVYQFGPGLQLGAGGSVTRNFVPDVFAPNYGESLWGGKVFIQLTAMEMWHSR